MDCLRVGKSKHGRGVYATKGFKKGQKIMDFGGKTATYDEIEAHYKEDEDYFVQISEDLYLGPSGSFDDYMNHSCNPNAGLRIAEGKAQLIAIRNIKKGDEVTWDYSTTMDEDDWEMECGCGHKKCRKSVRDFKHLPKEVKGEYIRLGIVPEYIIRRTD
ncbi:MAG: SET domain-containing protein-lysine N-methyltransferase [Candidatus Altiarchaeota archaeon]